jgi:hypothetical protein
MKKEILTRYRVYPFFTLCAVLILGSFQVAWADGIPYPDAGTYNNTTYSFTASGTDVNVYFAGTDALYDNYLMIYANGSILTDTISGNTQVLFNKTSSIGDLANYTGLSAGDILTFVIESSYNGSTYDISSVPSANIAYDSTPGLATYSGDNHIYSTAYTAGTTLTSQPYGGTLSTGSIPVNGTYIGFEDQSFSQLGGSDYSYNDEDFVFTGLRTNPVPEPATLMLFGFGILGLGAFRKRRP